MKIKWLGHATFLITSESGVRIITDPYEPNENLKYAPIKESADIVTVSHGHFDHSNVAAVGGDPKVIESSGEAAGISFEGVAVFHDDTSGSQRGNNTIFSFTVDGIRVCHLGDLGHLLSDAEAANVGKVDILLVPVGGFFTIDAATAGEVVEKLSPKIVIPMHYKNEKCDFPIGEVDDFTRDKDNVTILGVSEAEFHAGRLPNAPLIVVMEPAL